MTRPKFHPFCAFLSNGLARIELSILKKFFRPKDYAGERDGDSADRGKKAVAKWY